MKRLIALSVIFLFLLCLAMPSLKVFADSSNLIANPSVETASNGMPTNWTPDSWGSNTASLSYATTGHTGSHSLLATMSNHVSGDAKWIPDAAAITPGTSYTYTDYYEANVATELDAEYVASDGTASYVYLNVVPASATWAQASATFTAPANAAKVMVLHILAVNGSLQTDDFSLGVTVTVTPPPNTDGNLVLNPSFETTDASGPVDWQQDSWGSNTPVFSLVTNDGHSGTNSAKVMMTSYSSGDAKWVFNPVSIQPSTLYTFSDYYKANLATSLVAQYDNGSGSLSYQTLASEPAATTGWTSASTTFTTPATAKYVTIFHLIAGVGYLQIDDVSLLPQKPLTGNLLPNPSLETPDPTNPKVPEFWQHGSWGSNTATFAYLTTGHTGTRSIKTTISSYTSGAAYWYVDSQPITGGQMYDYSDYYKSNVPTEIDAGFTMSDGSQQDVYLGDAFRSPNSWTKFDTQFTAPAGAVNVTFYHDIYAVGYVTTDDYSLTNFSYQGFSRPIISITDDDSYASFYSNGLPLLQKYGFHSTDYIITGYINNVAGYMSSSMVKSLYASGQEIGSHTIDHPDLSYMSATSANTELQNSQTYLQNLLGVPVTDFAAPYGALNTQVDTIADTYYKSLRGVEMGYNAKNNFNANNLLVQNIVDTTPLSDIQSWINTAKATNTWLILVYHQVDPDPAAGEYNTYPSDFDAQLNAIKNSGVAVETVSQALQEIQLQL